MGNNKGTEQVTNEQAGTNEQAQTSAPAQGAKVPGKRGRQSLNQGLGTVAPSFASVMVPDAPEAFRAALADEGAARAICQTVANWYVGRRVAGAAPTAPEDVEADVLVRRAWRAFITPATK